MPFLAQQGSDRALRGRNTFSVEENEYMGKQEYLAVVVAVNVQY